MGANSKEGRVEPRLPRAQRDLRAAPARTLQTIIEVVRETYEVRGFEPLETPAIEALEVLIGQAGDDAHQQIFRVDSGEEEALGLRFDLTVPLSRHVARNRQEIARPFRRYQVAPVWRVEKPDPGRYREFIQADADIVGTTNPLADAEVIAALAEVYRKLLPPDEKGPRYRVRLSDRRVLDALVASAGLAPEQGPAVFRVLDKLDRLGKDKVALQLGAGMVDESGSKIDGLGLDESVITSLLSFLELAEGDLPPRREVFTAITERLASVDGIEDRLAPLSELLDLLDGLGLPEDECVLDVSIARGLAYYTGPVFETYLRDLPSFGSVGSGGRYDDLVTRFSAEAWPGVGASVGVSRFAAALEELGVELGGAARPGVEVLVTIVDKKRKAECLALVSELRAAGVRTEAWVGGSGSFSKQVRHGDRIGAPLVVIAGGDELARGVVSLKVMDAADTLSSSAASREQWLELRSGQSEVPRDELVGRVRSLLGLGAGADS